MTLARRDFLKTTLTASAALAGSASFASAAQTGAGREYYELRSYRLKPDGSAAPLHGYLEKAFLPALSRRGLKNTGVFMEDQPKDGPAVWVLITHPNLESVVACSTSLLADPALLSAGKDYLEVPRAEAAFERIDTWLLLAFKSMPKMEIPEFSRSRAPDRLFEMRTYESYSELKALKKMAMFDDGETEIMRKVKLAPLFFGQGIAGINLPHLTYMTCAPDAASHKAHWDAFRVDPDWKRMSGDPQYANTVSKNTPRFLKPTAYSEL
jgi:hypothetical protein